MKLTDKCKKDFEKWYENEYLNNKDYPYWIILSDFYDISFSMQYGVYVDFFAETKPKEMAQILLQIEYDYLIKHMDLNEARTEAILKANEIYNRNNKA